VVLTDGDPNAKITGIKRCVDLVQQIAPDHFNTLLCLFKANKFLEVQNGLKEFGLFVNDWTFETTLIDVGLHQELKDVFCELGEEIGTEVTAGAAYIDNYLADKTTENMKKILTSIADARWGKGRFAHRLLTHIQDKARTLKAEEKPSIVPVYIREGIEYIIDKVQHGRSAM
jgi:hypothetical protein